MLLAGPVHAADLGVLGWEALGVGVRSGKCVRMGCY